MSACWFDDSFTCLDLFELLVYDCLLLWVGYLNLGYFVCLTLCWICCFGGLKVCTLGSLTFLCWVVGRFASYEFVDSGVFFDFWWFVYVVCSGFGLAVIGGCALICVFVGFIVA